MNSTKIEPKYINKSNPRVGLIALASDFMIERDFIKVIKDRDIDVVVLSCSLCYMEKPYEVLNEIISYKPRFILISII